MPPNPSRSHVLNVSASPSISTLYPLNRCDALHSIVSKPKCLLPLPPKISRASSLSLSTSRNFGTNDDSAMAAWFEARPINIAGREGLAAKLRQRVDFVGIEKNGDGNVRMLDYACGSGFMSRVRCVSFRIGIGM
jgi:hypothetical protein